METAASEDRLAPDLALATGEGEAAEAAFGRLCELVRPAARRMLMRRGASPEDAEDALQSTFAQLWRTRATTRAKTGGEWYSLVRRAAAMGFFNGLGKNARDAEREQAYALASEDTPTLDAAVAALDAGWLREAADGLWLGESASIDARLGAATVQMVIEGGDEDEATATFGATRADLDRWLADPAVVLRALFSSLCWSPDDLAGYVLRPERPLSGRELDSLMQDDGGAEVPAGWSRDEAKIVCWRLRNGMRADEILLAASGTLDARRIAEVLERVRRALPHESIARVVRAYLEERSGVGPLASPGLWKRTVLEYALRETSQQQIGELARPPAGVAPFALGASRINNWLGGGRLADQLAAYLRRRGA